MVYIGGITRELTEADVRAKFSPFGTIVSILMKGNYAFTEYETE